MAVAVTIAEGRGAAAKMDALGDASMGLGSLVGGGGISAVELELIVSEAEDTSFASCGNRGGTDAPNSAGPSGKITTETTKKAVLTPTVSCAATSPCIIWVSRVLSKGTALNPLATGGRVAGCSHRKSI